MCGERQRATFHVWRALASHIPCVASVSEPHFRVASVASHLFCQLVHAHARGWVGGGRGRELQQPWQTWAVMP